MAQSKKLIVICGPTATGKTKLGVALAKALGGEVVSADSMQVYRGMPIGTAQPTPEERDGVPHHMMAMADPSENYSVARYVEEATACVEDIFARGKQPILVGGTGLYIDALCKGQTFSDFQPDSGLRAKLQAQAAQGGLPRLWADLERIDPEAAARLHPNDEKRILRALEVWYTTGKTISQHNRETQAVPPRYEALTITLTYADRQALYARIDQRVDEMMAHGLVKEIQALLAAGIPKDGDCHAGHWLQGAGPGRRQRRCRCHPTSRRRGEAPLPAVRQAAAELVPPKPQGPLDRGGQTGKYFQHHPGFDGTFSTKTE